MNATREMIDSLHREALNEALRILGDSTVIESVIVEAMRDPIPAKPWVAGVVMTSGRIHEAGGDTFSEALCAVAVKVRELE